LVDSSPPAKIRGVADVPAALAAAFLPAHRLERQLGVGGRDGVPLTVSLADGTTQVIQSPVINNVSGAMAIQEVLENTEWVSNAGSPVAYAPHLRRAPLPGVPAKSVIYQFAKGDLGAANPNTTAILRAGDLADRTLYYRHDLARAEIPSLPMNAHMFMVSIGVVAFRDISLGAQAQIAIFVSDARRSFTRNRRGSSRCRSKGRCRRS
jgi:hypothetical protein